MGTLLVSLVVRGYHVYRTLWEPFLGEEFVVLHETDNDYDHHAMAVYHILEVPHVIVGHLPQEISRVTYLRIMAWESPLSYSISIGVSIVPTFVQSLATAKNIIDSSFKFLLKLWHKMTDSKLGSQ